METPYEIIKLFLETFGLQVILYISLIIVFKKISTRIILHI